MKSWILAAALAAFGFALPARADSLEAGRRAAEAFLSGDVESLWTASTPEMREAFGSPEDLAAFRREALAALGAEEEVLSERVRTEDGHEVFIRRSRWTELPAALEILVAFDEAERVAGFFIRPQPLAAPSPHLDYETKAKLRLPVEGEWFVYWGGREIEENYHAADAGQRFALDLLVLQDGRSHEGDPAELANYHCWGRPILAPAAGLVARAVDGLPDQEIGASDPGNPAGNHVVIDFGEGEYGFLAHLRLGSVQVEAGERVSAGQEIGRCGNSGNSTEPHLHFHLQTSPGLGRGEGLPAQFADYLADGAQVERGEPARGQIIQALE